MSWRLRLAESADVDELMSWFETAEATNLWAGPKFRHPYSRETFVDDCRWQEFDNYCLSHDDSVVAFGQIGTRYRRCHFARLAVHPARRRQGIGKRLLSDLMAAAEDKYGMTDFGLFVYRHNEAALGCYRSLGYQVDEYPDGAPLQRECYYLTR